MAFITIDGKSYEQESLTPEAQARVTSIQFCDKRLSELQSELAVIHTARNAYFQELRELLPISEDLKQ